MTNVKVPQACFNQADILINDATLVTLYLRTSNVCVCVCVCLTVHVSTQWYKMTKQLHLVA